MEFGIILLVVTILGITMCLVFEYNIKKIKKLGKNEKLDEIAKKYPSNIELCKIYLKKLKNEEVTIEENKDTEFSLYIAITNKISIANISNTFTRIQTIAHECLHSIQDRKILIFNYIFSNIYLLYFITICALAIFEILSFKMLFLSIFLILSLVYCMVRMYLENDAMIKARYLAKEYLEEANISNREEIAELLKGFDDINKVGMKAIHYSFILNVFSKIIIYSVICIAR